MPKLQFFIVCDKAIVSQGDDDLSLIGIIDGIALENIPVPEGKARISFPYSWYAVSQWIAEEGDESKSFVQQVQIIMPNGEASGSSVTGFNFDRRPKAVNLTRGIAMPFVGPGSYLFQLSYHQLMGEDMEAEWQYVTDYPISISTGIPDEEVEDS